MTSDGTQIVVLFRTRRTDLWFCVSPLNGEHCWKFGQICSNSNINIHIRIYRCI
jgi:hypothetical protein